MPTASGAMPMNAERTLMHHEAAAASAVVAAQLQRNATLMPSIAQALRTTPPRAIVTCARGSSDHAATFAKYMFELYLGVLTSSAFPSINSVYGAKLDLSNTLYLVISQSGRSPDLLANVAAARNDGATVMAIVNNTESPLAELADIVVPMHAGEERSVAATKSYIATLSAIVHLVSEWRDDDALRGPVRALPDQLAAAWQLDWTAGCQVLSSARNFYVIGRGPGMGVAQEAALKFKETCGLHAEAFSAAEVQHGPMAIVVRDFPVLVFVPNDASRAGTDELIDQFLKRGAVVLAAGPATPTTTAITLPVIADADAFVAPILQVQSFYRMANSLAVERGYNPDEPLHLRKVTETL